MLSSVAVACLRSSPIASILRRGTSCFSSCRGSGPLSSRSLASGSNKSRSTVFASKKTMSAAAAAALDPSSSSSSDPPPFRVAVVGGGLAGAAAASTIAAADASSRVTLFDAGFRGVGGRASSRPLLRGEANATKNPTTDHGCQFVVDDGSDARLSALLRQSGATEWRDEESRFVSLDFETGRVRAKGEEREEGEGAVEEGDGDFFGVLAKGSAVWVGSPTSDAIPKRLVGDSSSSKNIDVRVGWKVTAVAREGAGGGGGGGGGEQQWRVSARPPPPPPGSGAAPVAEGGEAAAPLLFDAVVLSDASAMRAGSASAVAVELPSGGAPSAPLEALARSRRAPLFSVAAVLPAPLSRDSVPFDVAVVRGDKSDVAVLVRESAKPGRRGEGNAAGEGEVWVAVSSRAAAAELLALAPPSRGPPSPEALERAAERLWEAASTALQRAAAAASEGGSPAAAVSIPPPLALRAQRWGAGLETNPERGALFSLDDSTMLAACGDVFGSGDAAAALLSGVAAGEALLRAAAEKKRTKSGARSSL